MSVTPFASRMTSSTFMNLGGDAENITKVQYIIRKNFENTNDSLQMLRKYEIQYVCKDSTNIQTTEITSQAQKHQ